MKNVDTTWNVLRHGPIERLAENLHRVTGALPGMSLERTMTIVRREDGTLLVHSPIAMDDARMRELEALGRPAILIVPNAYHRLDAPAWKVRYPEMRVLGPRGSRAKIEERIRLDATYEDFPADGAVRVEYVDGVDAQEGAFLVKSSDGTTVILNDAMMNMDPKKDLLGRVFTTIMGSAPGPRVSRFAKLGYVKDQPALRRQLERYAEIPDLVRLVVSHEKVAHGEDARAALRTAATFLRA